MTPKKRPLRRIILALLGDEKQQRFSIPIAAILLSLIFGGIVILIIGKNPLIAYKSLLQGAGLWPKANYAGGKGLITDFMSFLDAWTPMLFASLSVAVAAKAGLFNIGVSGQMLIAGFAATVLVGYSGLAAVVAKPLVLLIGMVVGALAGGFIGWLKHRFNINEVVTAIMLNYIIQYITSFFIYTRYLEPVSRQSAYINAAARLTLNNVQVGNYKMVIPLAFPLAIIIAVLMHYLINKTRIGFEIRTVGLNKNAARYAGVNVGRTLVVSMLVSGALAGLAGVTYYLGYYASIQPRTLTSMGFDAIAVSLLGNSSPLGIIAASFLISAVFKGSTYMSSAVGVQDELASVIIGIILLFAACGAYIRYRSARARDKQREEDQLRKASAAEGGEAK